MKTVIIPKENEPDLQDIPESVLESLKIVKAENVDEVLKEALMGEFKELPSENSETNKKQPEETEKK